MKFSPIKGIEEKEKFHRKLKRSLQELYFRISESKHFHIQQNLINCNYYINMNLNVKLKTKPQTDIPIPKLVITP